MTKLAVSDLDRQIEQLKRCDLIKESEVKILCQKAKEILVEEANVQRVYAPVTVRQSISQSVSLSLSLKYYIAIVVNHRYIHTTLIIIIIIITYH